MDSLRRDIEKLKENAHAIQVGYGLCGGTHLNKECPLNEEVKGVEEVTEKENESLNMYALADLGANVSIVPYSMFQSLKLTSLKETIMLVEMVDMSKKDHRGIVENGLVEIDKFVFPSDFVVIDMLEDPHETLIFGTTLRAQGKNEMAEHGMILTEVTQSMERMSMVSLSNDIVFCNNERRDIKCEDMEFCDYLQTRYGNTKIDDTARKRRYDEWFIQNYRLLNYPYRCAKGSTSEIVTGKPHLGTYIVTPHGVINPDQHKDPFLKINSYFPDFTQEGRLEEEEKRKCLDGTHYDPFELSVDTYEVKWYSFGNMESFVCVKKMLKEELPIGSYSKEKTNEVVLALNKIGI
ncbi:putative reverse transcriptase domain-containing protein [Tanacetum coccineum]